MSEFAGAFPAPSWTPPAREPFVPLRPLTLGQILAGAFRALRHNPAVTLAPAIVLSVTAALASTGFSRLLLEPLVGAVGGSSGAVELYSWLSGFGAGAIGVVVSVALDQGAGILQQGVSASDVSHAVVGRRLTPGGLRRRTRGVRGPLVAWAAIVVAVVVVLGVLGAALLGALDLAMPLGGLLGGVLLYPAAAVLAAWLGTKLAVVPSAIVVERLRLGAALRRSWRLTRRNFWRVLGIRILCWAMIALAVSLVGIPVQLIVSWLVSLLAGNGDMGDMLAITAAGDVVRAIVGAVIAAIGLVVTTATDAILYLDLRMRREGLDLELARFMERRRPSTRFDPEEADPYRPPAEVGAASVLPQPAADVRGSAWG